MTVAPKVPAEPVTFIEGKSVGWIAECPFCRHVLHISSEPPLAAPAPPPSELPKRGGWFPTAESINALPTAIRKYIHDLETRCDPAGEVRELTMLKDQVRELAASNKMLREKKEEVPPPSDPPKRGSWRWLAEQIASKGLPLPPLLPSAALLRGESPQSHWPYALHNEERALVKELIATVERLCNGLEWNLQHHPTIMNQSDEEALAEARAVLARTQFQQLKETPHDPR